jgi:uncharacterized repeat protein (TIGR03803 family)
MQSKKSLNALTVVLAIFAVALLAVGTHAAAQQVPDVPLYSFLGGADGSEPSGNLALYKGTLYGTTVEGGDNFGTVFELTKAGGVWTKRPIYTFAGNTDGSGPSGLISDSNGNLYGTTSSGGTSSVCGGCGTVFELSETGGVWTKTILHSFGASTNDGQYPYGGLVLSPSGDLYGTTAEGGTQQKCSGSAEAGCGTAFELKPKTGGGWTYGVLYSFGRTNDGQTPNGVIFYKNHLYGATEDGGADGEGTVFEMAPPTATVKHWTEKVLYSFEGYNSNDGALPSAGVTVDDSGDLWGTTSQGGDGLNNGIVFELTEAAGVWTEKVILSFPGSEGVYPDGLFPLGLTYDASSGNFYGTMEEAGTVEGGESYGTVYELTAATGVVTVLHDFSGSATNDGAFPSSGLILDGKGNVYGTTSQGGVAMGATTLNNGTVFELTP